jgi:hypothetical protein
MDMAVNSDLMLALELLMADAGVMAKGMTVSMNGVDCLANGVCCTGAPGWCLRRGEGMARVVAELILTSVDHDDPREVEELCWSCQCRRGPASQTPLLSVVPHEQLLDRVYSRRLPRPNGSCFVLEPHDSEELPEAAFEVDLDEGDMWTRGSESEGLEGLVEGRPPRLNGLLENAAVAQLGKGAGCADGSSLLHRMPGSDGRRI